MRYTPLGWSKTYEISDAELRSGCDTIDQWLDIVAKGRANISPEQIPWKDRFHVMMIRLFILKFENFWLFTLYSNFLYSKIEIKPLMKTMSGYLDSSFTGNIRRKNGQRFRPAAARHLFEQNFLT